MRVVAMTLPLYASLDRHARACHLRQEVQATRKTVVILPNRPTTAALSVSVLMVPAAPTVSLRRMSTCLVDRGLCVRVPRLRAQNLHCSCGATAVRVSTPASQPITPSCFAAASIGGKHGKLHWSSRLHQDGSPGSSLTPRRAHWLRRDCASGHRRSTRPVQGTSIAIPAVTTTRAHPCQPHVFVRAPMMARHGLIPSRLATLGRGKDAVAQLQHKRLVHNPH